MADRRATLKDVAVASGVSPTTVSFVLNRTPGQSISAATRERVEATAQQLGYVPHGLARALREGASRIVVLSVPRMWGGGSLQGFLRGVRDELGSRGYALVVHASQDGQDGVGEQDGADEELARSLAGLQPYAVLDLASPYTDDDDEADGGWVDGLAAHSFTQLQHLTEQGHREVALALPERDGGSRAHTARARYARESAEQLDLPPLQEIIMPADGEQASRTLRALRSDSPQITAVAGFDDETALRVLAAMADLQLAAPQDLAVIGFDEGHHAALWRPALTTVRIEAETFGRRAARSVLGLAVGDWPVAPSSVVRRDTA